MPTATNVVVSLYYEVFGLQDDPVSLLVNGLGSQCINFKVELCEKYVQSGFRIVRFDNRDVGLSSHLKGGPSTPWMTWPPTGSPFWTRPVPNEPTCRLEAGRATASAIPDTRLETIEGMGHDYPPQYWDRLVELITTHAKVSSPTT